MSRRRPSSAEVWIAIWRSSICAIRCWPCSAACASAGPAWANFTALPHSGLSPRRSFSAVTACRRCASSSGEREGRCTRCWRPSSNCRCEAWDDWRKACCIRSRSVAISCASSARTCMTARSARRCAISSARLCGIQFSRPWPCCIELPGVLRPRRTRISCGRRVRRVQLSAGDSDAITPGSNSAMRHSQADALSAAVRVTNKNRRSEAWPRSAALSAACGPGAQGRPGFRRLIRPRPSEIVQIAGIPVARTRSAGASASTLGRQAAEALETATATRRDRLSGADLAAPIPDRATA